MHIMRILKIETSPVLPSGLQITVLQPDKTQYIVQITDEAVEDLKSGEVKSFTQGDQSAEKEKKSDG